jgi:hypothetical protein
MPARSVLLRHGLSYTSFAYRWASGLPAVVRYTDGGGGGGTVCSVKVLVSNTGSTRGAEVVQLYVRFPAELHEPPLVLRAFAKTPVLEAGHDATVQLDLRSRDLSIWSPTDMSGSWKLAYGNVTVFVGTSSRDLKLNHTFQLSEA